MDTGTVMLASLVSATGSIYAGMDAMDAQHREAFAVLQEAAWLDREDFAEVLTERKAAGIQDYRVRHRTASKGYKWCDVNGRLVRR